MEQKEQYKTLKALGIAFVGAGVALGGAHLVGWNNQVDVSKLATTADVKVISDSLNSSVSADNSLLVAAADKILEEDKWEATAEVLSLEELEDKDFKELKQWVLDEYSEDFLESDDYKDFEGFKVVVKDKEVTDSDSDDEDADVEFELRVYYEDKDGDSVKRAVKVLATVEDGEVEDLKFENLD